MRGGEAVLKELARLTSRAILYRQSGLALRLQREAMASATSSMKRRRSISRPISPT
jgi:hypothetical protein